MVIGSAELLRSSLRLGLSGLVSSLLMLACVYALPDITHEIGAVGWI